MGKINISMMMLAVLLTANIFLNARSAKADNETVANNTVEVLHDEGYGNSDAEYYNSEDDQVNDEELASMENEAVGNIDASSPENSLANAQ